MKADTIERRITSSQKGCGLRKPFQAVKRMRQDSQVAEVFTNTKSGLEIALYEKHNVMQRARSPCFGLWLWALTRSSYIGAILSPRRTHPPQAVSTSSFPLFDFALGYKLGQSSDGWLVVPHTTFP